MSGSFFAQMNYREYKKLFIKYAEYLSVCRRSEGDSKQAEMTKRKLSADLVLTKSHLDIKKRDGECPIY